MDINYLAIIVAGLVAFVIGALWYSPALFGKQWMALTGMKMEDGKKQGMWKYYLSGLLSYVVMAYVLSWVHQSGMVFMEHIGQPTTAIKSGLMAGFWSWLGFVATVTLGGVLWEKKPFKLYILNNAYTLVALLVMGLILGAWQ